MARVDTILRDARERLATTSDSPDLDARRLLEHVLGVNHAWLIVHGGDALDANAQRRFDGLLEQRITGEPLAYVIGRIGFWTLELEISRDVLVPRPDTETLVEAVLDRIDGPANRTLLDLGTGSGAVALSLAEERPNWRITATDASERALACAKANAQRFALPNVEFCRGDWYRAVGDARFDVIVSNPPYIAPGDAHLAAPALTREPRAALVAERDGLADLEQIVAGAGVHLRPGGRVFLEHGADQGAAVRRLLAAAGFVDTATLRDLGGNERVSTGRLDEKAP